MLKMLQESNIRDNIYSLIENLKNIQQTLEEIVILPSDVYSQIQIQNIIIKNSVDKIEEIIRNL